MPRIIEVSAPAGNLGHLRSRQLPIKCSKLPSARPNRVLFSCSLLPWAQALSCMDINRTGYSERWQRLKIKRADDETWAQSRPQTSSLVGFATWVTSCHQSGHKSLWTEVLESWSFPSIFSVLFPSSNFTALRSLPHVPCGMDLQAGTDQARASSLFCGTPEVHIIDRVIPSTVVGKSVLAITRTSASSYLECFASILLHTHHQVMVSFTQ